jgi:ATP synthase subunit 6
VERASDFAFLTPKGQVTLLSDQITALLAAVLLTMFLPILVRRAGADRSAGWCRPASPTSSRRSANTAQEAHEPIAGATPNASEIPLELLLHPDLNLIGLLPIALSALFGLLGGTATGNIWFTASMALVTLVLIVVNGLRFGGIHYIKHFCPGPLWLAPVLIPVEIIGLFAKAFSLAVRLFANMLAGHVLIGVLLGFILQIGTALGSGAGYAMAIPIVAASVAVSMLELFVAFLQAFIFSFLTALFVGMAVNVHHEEHHSEAAEAH